METLLWLIWAASGFLILANLMMSFLNKCMNFLDAINFYFRDQNSDDVE